MTDKKKPKNCAFYLAESTEPVDKVIAYLATINARLDTRTHLAFSNWDTDPRELYDIPEMQAWCREFIQKGGLSLLDRMEDLPSGFDPASSLPSQLLVVACAGMPGATRGVGKLFHYDLDKIEALEREYRN